MQLTQTTMQKTKVVQSKRENKIQKRTSIKNKKILVALHVQCKPLSSNYTTAIIRATIHISFPSPEQ